MEHLRFGEGGQRRLERRPAGLVDAARSMGVGERVVIAEGANHADHVGMLEEDQLAVSVVVRKRAERFRAQRDRGTEAVRPGAVEGRWGEGRWGEGHGDSPRRLVDAAEAVDGHLKALRNGGSLRLQ